MIIQMFGMDAKTRTEIGEAVAKKIDAWYLASTDLPMGHTQPQQARWLRVVSKVFDRSYHGDIITSGFFATAEAREQYKIERGRSIPDLAIYVDTIAHEDFDKIPGYLERKVHLVDNHDGEEFQELNYWEEPEQNEYDIHITTTGDAVLDSIDNRVNIILEAVEKYKNNIASNTN
jgi:hypothetical protein